MSDRDGILAGRAFVELMADNSKLKAGLDEAQAHLKAHGSSYSLLSDKWLKHGIGIYAYSKGLAGGLHLITAGIRGMKGDWKGMEEQIEELPFGIGKVFKAAMTLIEEIDGTADRKREEAKRKAIRQAQEVADEFTTGITNKAALIGVHDETYKGQVQAFQEYQKTRREIAKQYEKDIAELGLEAADHLVAPKVAAAKDLYQKTIKELEAQRARHLHEDSQKSDELMNAAIRKPGFKGDREALKARQKIETDAFQGGAPERAAMEDRHRAEGYAQDLKYAGEAADALRDMQTEINKLGGPMTEFDVEWDKLTRKFEGMDDWDQKAGKLKSTMKELFRLRAEDGINKQVEDLSLKISVASGRMTELDAAVARSKVNNPLVTEGKAKQLFLTEKRATDAEWARGELNNLKTPAEKMADLKKRLLGLADVMKRADLEKIWDAANKGKESTQGIFNAANLLGLQSGGPEDRIAKATEKTAENTEKLHAAVKDGGKFT